MLGGCNFRLLLLLPLFFVSRALHEGGVAGVVEWLALWSGAFSLWSAWDWR